jgi:hypothetical protein
MKTIFRSAPLLLIIIFSAKLKAQDTLFLFDGTKIASQILEVGISEIKYKKENNPDGPTFITYKSDVNIIKYRNGLSDTLKTIKPLEQTPVIVQKTPAFDQTPPIYRTGPIYKQGGRIKESYMHSALNRVHDNQIDLHVKNAKIAKGVQYVGFLAIPAVIAGGVFAVGTLINSYSSSDYDFTPSITCGTVAVMALSTSITAHSMRVKNNDAAIKIYNEKY